MTSRPLRLTTLALLLSLPELAQSQAAPPRDLTGTWEGVIRLDSTWRLRDRASSRATVARIRFAAVGDASPATTSARTVHPATFEIDFGRFGFALSSHDALGWFVGRDSVRAVLNPAVDHGTVELGGVMRGDTIAGTWRYTSDPGGAAGTFLLRRVAAPRDQLRDFTAFDTATGGDVRSRSLPRLDPRVQTPTLANDDLRDRIDIRNRRAEVHDARSKRESVVDHGVGEVDLSALLETRE